ncbi:MAG: hypothetical protein VYE73_18765, partial [Acidobacteriota bacterium]|nr:hypothetical protein [Acidobacteriota bacterium]
TCDRLKYCGRCHAQAVAADGVLYGPSSWAQKNAQLIERALGIERPEQGPTDVAPNPSDTLGGP